MNYLQFNNFKCIVLTILLIVHQDVDSSELRENKAEWTGSWFPNKPGQLDTNEISNDDILATTSTTVLPLLQPEHPAGVVNNTETEKWKGIWFPNQPGAKDLNTIEMGVSNSVCDDAKTNLQTDFDPSDVRDEEYYLCLSKRSLYRPNYDTEPVQTVFNIPAKYVPIHKCMTEKIFYNESIPTFGTHRPLWPKFGEYEYVPVQRWVHNLEHGAIVALYHPCANSNEVDKFTKLVKSCLYRHIITPSQKVSAERPMALVGWGQRLEFSVVDAEVVKKFIRDAALKGPEKVFRNGQYDQKLKQEAKIVSDIKDSELCPSTHIETTTTKMYF